MTRQTQTELAAVRWKPALSRAMRKVHAPKSLGGSNSEPLLVEGICLESKGLYLPKNAGSTSDRLWCSFYIINDL
jgi:hypothetical protein